ncbi:uncharacterized protein MELLADRAFT_107265 [Melampsora larici-populina 98AG31]|uniref:Uncharacterized protein n=1 Tax=Melampsora larici-populina (strain 98AG31 / pathotype 3-4-7) TaxID=747676 RepID=F4RPD6_MELLP|nr:uncharacterized protein MELLADRAFT_107265 [Melampsora larici-populina 98AG31]EGG05868.1 hypothetical protein MELLADRAFT_107265 [Melampsora larici-populina 98AG31]
MAINKAKRARCEREEVKINLIKSQELEETTPPVPTTLTLTTPAIPAIPAIPATKPPKTERQMEDINHQYLELDNSHQAANAYHELHPGSIKEIINRSHQLEELREFNFLRKKLELESSKTASIPASIETAMCSMRQQQNSDPDCEGAGVHHARKIRQLAAFVILHQRLPEENRGKLTVHSCMLDNMGFLKAITDWIATVRVGKVMFLLL